MNTEHFSTTIELLKIYKRQRELIDFDGKLHDSLKKLQELEREVFKDRNYQEKDSHLAVKEAVLIFKA